MLPKDCHENQAILLSQATECLAKAAIALSEAAEAMAAAAKSFIPDITSIVSVSQPPETAQTSVISAIVDYESDSDSSPTTEDLATPTKPTNNVQGKQHKNSEFTRIAGEGSIFDTDDEEYLSAQSTLRGTQSNASLTVATQPPTADDTPGTETETQPPPPSYRILLEDEADVLLAACSLIRRGRKVVCYVRSSITALDVYETLLSAAKVPVHRIKSSSSQELERVLETFQHGHSSVLLFPATHTPDFRINEPDSWVIHVGWPVNEELYKQQITNHQAKNNVFVAYSEDKDIYPSSSGILTHAQPWPHGELILKEACTNLRPAFNKKLAEIPAKIKAKVYPDWITLHGMRGPYHPPSWTASTLVYRANLYLLDVFRYNAGASDVPSGTHIALPTVSAGFVTSQSLESAVEEGVLRVKSSSGLNHISSLPHDAIPAGTISLNEAETPKPSGDSRLNSGPAPDAHYVTPSIPPSPKSKSKPKPKPESAWGSLDSSSLTYTPSRSSSRIGSIAEFDTNRLTSRQENATLPPHVKEYLIIENDLDVFPTVCHLSTRPNTKNVLCFVKSLNIFFPLVKMLEQMISKPVFSGNANYPLSESIRSALHSPVGCLLLCNMYSGLPIGLEDVRIDLTVHLGWGDNPTIYCDQTQHSKNTVILLRRETQAPNGPELIASLDQTGVSPASMSTKRLYNRQSKSSILEPERKKWKELLTSSTSVSSIRASYMGWITHHCQGQHKEQEWTAIDVATHANRFFKGLFRCGSGGDVFQDQPSVSQRFVEHLGLEAAVAAGLLTVKG